MLTVTQQPTTIPPRHAQVQPDPTLSEQHGHAASWPQRLLGATFVVKTFQDTRSRGLLGPHFPLRWTTYP